MASRAETAGLKAGDVIISFDNKPIVEPKRSAEDRRGNLARQERRGKDNQGRQGKVLTIKVGSRADEETTGAQGEKDKETTPDKLFGITVQPMTQELAKKLGVASVDGVVVTAVQLTLLRPFRVRRWDIIREIDRRLRT